MGRLQNRLGITDIRPAVRAGRFLLTMKRLCKFLLSGLLCLFVSGAGHALEKVDFIVSGRDKGSVSALESNGVTYVDVQKTARKIGTGIELFAQSKQAKISTKGFYAILTAPLAEIIVNAQPKTLSAPVLIQGSKMMVPAEFFLLPQNLIHCIRTSKYEKCSRGQLKSKKWPIARLQLSARCLQ